MIRTSFFNNGRWIIHKDNLDVAVKELEAAIRDLLMDALWMGCNLRLSRNGTMISISMEVYDLVDSEEEEITEENQPLLEFTADIFKDMDASGFLSFSARLIQSITLPDGRTVEDVVCREYPGFII